MKKSANQKLHKVAYFVFNFNSNVKELYFNLDATHYTTFYKKEHALVLTGNLF